MKFYLFLFLMILIGQSHAGKWVNATKGCKVWSDLPEPGDRAEWIGKCQNGKAQGNGTLYFRNGTKVYKYQGNMIEGKQESTGIQSHTWADGSHYEGDYKNNVREGKGVYISAFDGSRYEGEWKDDKRNGKGIRRFGANGRYEGDWKNDQYDGQGVLNDGKGTIYDGGWKEGSFHGYGRYQLAKGHTTIGAYEVRKVGQWQGNNYVVEGIWSNYWTVEECQKQDCKIEKD